MLHGTWWVTKLARQYKYIIDEHFNIKTIIHGPQVLELRDGPIHQGLKVGKSFAMGTAKNNDILHKTTLQ